LKKLEDYKGKDAFLAAVPDVDAMIIRSDIVDAAILDAATKTKIIVRAGAGYDNILESVCGQERSRHEHTRAERERRR